MAFKAIKLLQLFVLPYKSTSSLFHNFSNFGNAAHVKSPYNSLQTLNYVMHAHGWCLQ